MSELQNMVATSLAINDSPSVVRYPRGVGVGHAIAIGKGRIIRNKAPSPKEGSVAILSLGTRLLENVKAAEALEANNIPVTVADARFMKPLDRDLIRKLVNDHEIIITVEEGSIGGFGDHVVHFAVLEGMLDDGKVKIRPMVLPDRYIDHGSQGEQYEEAGLSASHIEATAMRLVGRSATVLTSARALDLNQMQK
ncbi:unnamed protein product [Chondrus crispus]|uniref:Transketolase C-terminal domain-containing protein n=1 Tax=Chondrus crispus TaxID=2769 RepID=R7Q4C7_CHOCR|nr:unnamed protein product [Chondrus crispus]CDF32723.1 unnamed protein product [Chondrus crispus]|eukprot:XP_005712494.1 unnamed protein product [Chondrus crispus]